MISGVWRWPVSLSGGFSRSRRCCVAVFCEASGFWKYRGQRRARGETTGGAGRRTRALEGWGGASRSVRSRDAGVETPETIARGGDPAARTSSPTRGWEDTPPSRLAHRTHLEVHVRVVTRGVRSVLDVHRIRLERGRRIRRPRAPADPAAAPHARLPARVSRLHPPNAVPSPSSRRGAPPTIGTRALVLRSRAPLSSFARAREPPDGRVPRGSRARRPPLDAGGGTRSGAPPPVSNDSPKRAQRGRES